MRRFFSPGKTSVLCLLAVLSVGEKLTAQPVSPVIVNVVNKKNAIPSFMTLSTPSPTSSDDVSMARWFRSDMAANTDFKLQAVSSATDMAGNEHFKYRQFYKGVPVEGSLVRAHYSDGKLMSVNGDYYPALKIPMTALLDEKRALEIAFREFPAGAHFAWQDKMHEHLLQQIKKDDKASFFPQAETVVVSKGFSLKQEDFRLAYKFNIFSLEPLTRKVVYVDARNGEVLYTGELIHTTEVPALAYTRYSGMQKIICDSVTTDTLVLYETTRGDGVLTLNAKQCMVSDSLEMFVNNTRTWNNFNAQQDEVATDIHWSLEQTFDFYLNRMGRKSVDDKGQLLVGLGHFGKKFNNAFWNGTFAAFGDGDSINMYPLTSIDICAHEVTHGVTAETSGLLYDNEPGALNESFSDIMGKSVEHYALPIRFSWQIGAHVLCGKTPMRDMKDPNATLQPKFFEGKYYYIGHDDNGGVHTNSGVQNYWFYLLCEGGSGIRESDGAPFLVKSIGWGNASLLAYTTLTNYITVSSGYVDVAYYSMTAAKWLFGVNSEVARQVQMAWYAVGLADEPLPNTIAEVNNTAAYSFYPNPVNGGTLHINLNHEPGDAALQLLDMTGKVVAQLDHPQRSVDWDIAFLSAGVYLLQLNDGQSVPTRTKVIKY